MKVTILGGGDIGTLMAAECARKGHRVTVHTLRPGLWSHELCVHDPEDAPLFSARIAEVTNDLARSVRGAEVVFITLPAETFPELAREPAPQVRAGQRMGIIPGSGGAEFSFRNLLQTGACLFEVQRVHSIARLRELWGWYTSVHTPAPSFALDLSREDFLGLYCQAGKQH